MARTPKVALLIETSRGYGRALLRGIVRYARLHGPWGFYVTPGDFEQVLPRMRSWGGTGIIARIETPEVARAILDSGLPTIALDLSADQLRPITRFLGSARLLLTHTVRRGWPRSTCSSEAFATTPTSACTVESGRSAVRKGSAPGFVRRALSLTSTFRPGPARIASGSASSPSWCAGSATCPGRSACWPATTNAGERSSKPAGSADCKCRRRSPWSASTMMNCSASLPIRRFPVSP